MKTCICKCGKQFNNSRSLQGHMRTCKKYKEWRDENKKQQLLAKESKRLPNGMFKCENCGKEHDGSYGSGRFCSLSCRKSYNGKQNVLNLIRCGTRKGKHQNHNKQRAPYGRWKCVNCDFIGNTRRELEQHRKLMHDVKFIWNKGLTKESDDRVAKNAKHVSESFKQHIADGYVNPTWTKEYWTEERRHERSEQKKKLYSEHPEKHPNRKLAGNRKQMTYPEQIAFDWLTNHNIIFEHQKEFCFDGNKRFVDFYIPSRKLFIEIDGEYWHKEGNEADKIKDELAKVNGYQTLRIKPKNNVIKQLEDFFNL